jgi:rhodanese-related sulfurtransferase
MTLLCWVLILAMLEFSPGPPMSASPHSDYAGDLSVQDAWNLLAQDPKAQLIDVRSVAEWNFVGLPDLSSLERALIRIEWQSFPSMQPNPNFVPDAIEKLGEAGSELSSPVLFLCRTGARSRAAAMAMARAGYRKAFNIESGFEGEIDSRGHRGAVNGWKAAGLPWRQT